jgi:TPR repeat protein
MIVPRLVLAALAAAVLAKPGVAQPKSTPQQTSTAPGDPDPAYTAFQLGRYLTAFREATKRIEEQNDPKSMTLLGELYANGLGVVNDDNKAADWYRLAAARNEREATFALAMFKMSGRAGPVDRKEGARLLEQAAKLGHVIAAYNLALLYLEGQLFPQDFARAAELMRSAAEAGNPEAQYALATFYKEGRGVKQDATEAARLLAQAARAGNIPSEVEYGIALFNGTGVTKDERAAGLYFMKAAQKGDPVGQNRLALMYATGRGLKADPVEAGRWYLIARAGGNSDTFLEDFLRKMNAADRAAAEAKAKPSLDLLQAVSAAREAPSPASASAAPPRKP